MAETKYISSLTISGTAYSIKDAGGRDLIAALDTRVTTNEGDIETLKAAVKGGAHFLGKVDNSTGKTPALTDGCHTTPIYIVGKTDAVTPTAGDFVIQAGSNTTTEFIWDGIAGGSGETAYTGTWRELGSTGTLKAMAFVDKGTFTYTPAGSVATENSTVETDTVTNPTFTGTQATLTGSFTGTTDQALSVAGTPTGTVSQPTFAGDAVTPTGSFTGTEGDLSVSGTPTGTVSTPTIAVQLETTSFDKVVVTAPAEGSEVLAITTVATTYANGTVTSATSTQPTFTGSALTSTGKFTPAGSVAVDALTPTGTVSQPTFTGSELTSTGKFTAAGTIAIDPYTPAGTNSGTAVTLKAHNHSASFTGTEATVDVSPKAS